MTLKEMLKENNLLQYVENICNSLNRIKLDSYEKIENGFLLSTGKNKYKVIVKKSDYNDIYVYYGEKLINYGMLEGYEKIPCSTSSEENKYPRLVGWIGTALADSYNSL